MDHLDPNRTNPWQERNEVSLAKRVAAPVVTLLAVALASLVAFLAIVWLDDFMRVFNPSVIRLGSVEDMTIGRPPLPWPISSLPHR